MIKKRRWISASSSYWTSLATWKKILISSLIFLCTVFVFPFILFFVCVICILSIPIVILGIFICCFVKKFIEVSEKWKWESPLSFSFEANDDPFSSDEFFPNFPSCSKTDKSKDEEDSENKSSALEEEITPDLSSQEDKQEDNRIEQDKSEKESVAKNIINNQVPYRRSYYNQE